MDNQMKNYPWLSHYPENVAWDMSIEPRPVYDLLHNAVRDFGAHNAMDFMGKKLTWSEVANLAASMAKGLQAQGVVKGSKIGLFLPNCSYYLISYYAVLMAGGVVVNLNPLYAEGELYTLVQDSEVEFIISADLSLLYNKIKKLKGVGRLRHVILCRFAQALPFPKNILFPIFKAKECARIEQAGDYLWYNDLILGGTDYTPVQIDPVKDLAVLQYTGGTTGTPKGAMLTHNNVYANAIQAKAWFHEVRAGQDKMMGVLPFFHVFAMTAVMNFSVANALEIICLPRFELKTALKTIHKKRPQLFPAVPAIYNAINNAAARAKYDLSSLKYCLSGGAPLPVEVKKRFEALNPNCIVIEGYGLTESSPVACANPASEKSREGSIGMPFPGTIIEIIDPADKMTSMPIGMRGELCIRGPQVMLGYWKNEAASADVLKPTGEGDVRLHTGDIAVMDADGYVRIVDRIKDMIITNGYKVYPRNVEEAIYQHDAVEECIVAGLKDAQRGEIVKVWIKCKDGKSLTEHDLRAFLKDKISPMEIPKKYEFRSEALPKTMIGKLSRKDVLAQEKAPT